LAFTLANSSVTSRFVSMPELNPRRSMSTRNVIICLVTQLMLMNSQSWTPFLLVLQEPRNWGDARKQIPSPLNSSLAPQQCLKLRRIEGNPPYFLTSNCGRALD
jgi:hypothetical protein